jgi:hypothetical protein
MDARSFAEPALERSEGLRMTGDNNRQVSAQCQRRFFGKFREGVEMSCESFGEP